MPTLAEVLDFIKAAKKGAATKISDLINQDPQQLSMEGRANFLPYQDTLPGSVMNQRSWALPGIAAGGINAITAPRRAMQGGYEADEAGNITPTFNAPEEAMNTAISTMGGGMGASRVAPPPAGSIGMNVYHGSPHRFPATKNNPYGEFDQAKIGTGEGAQAYGVGAAYLAENPEVAMQYRFLENKPFWEQTGNLYKVDLADKQIPKMLDWDKPFNKQHPEVQQALVNIANGLDENSKMLKLMQNGNPSGKDIFHSLLTEPQLIDSPNGWISVDNKKEISKLLQTEGVPGIRYLDQGSRGAGQGTSNFVVFDPAHMNIIGRE